MKKEKKYFLFFSQTFPDTPVGDSAHYIHEVQCANATARLGYPALLVYGRKESVIAGVAKFIFPLTPQEPEKLLMDSFGARANLMTLPLPVFWPMDSSRKFKMLNSAVITNKYYFPLRLASRIRQVHTQDFLMAEAAVRSKIPMIYEQHYEQKIFFKPEIVKSPYFKMAICQHEKVRENLIRYGMPAHKAIVMDNGFEEEVLVRYSEAAQDWRAKLLTGKEKYLAVYSGALFDFKGISLLIDAAKFLPNVKFVLTGGSGERVSWYRAKAEQRKVRNIHFLGWVEPRNSIFSLLQAADVLLEPSLSGEHAEYTNPVKFFQYLGSGSPIVGTTIPPYKKFIDKELCIVWTEPDYAARYAEAVQLAIERYPRKEEGYSQNINFSKQYTWEKRMEKIFQHDD